MSDTMSDAEFQALKDQVARLTAERERERANAAALDEAKEQLPAIKPPPEVERYEAKMAREARERAQAAQGAAARHEAHLEAVQSQVAPLLAELAALAAADTEARQQHAEAMARSSKRQLELSRRIADLQRSPEPPRQAEPAPVSRKPRRGMFPHSISTMQAKRAEASERVKGVN